MRHRDKLVIAARAIAEVVHEEQMYGDKPYMFHLDHVVSVLERFGITTPDILAAGYMHDSLEDTDIGMQTLKHLSPWVADIVNAVTDGEGINRKERKKRPYKLIPQTDGALLVKLADRIANVEDAIAVDKNAQFNMYRKEHKSFIKNLRKLSSTEPLPIRNMWMYLARLLQT